MPTGIGDTPDGLYTTSDGSDVWESYVSIVENRTERIALGRLLGSYLEDPWKELSIPTFNYLIPLLFNHSTQLYYQTILYYHSSTTYNVWPSRKPRRLWRQQQQ